MASKKKKKAKQAKRDAKKSVKKSVKKKKVRKTTDSWKKKEWYTIYSPSVFEEKEVGTTIADDEKKLVNRVIKVPLREITNNMNHQFIKLWLRTKEVKGKSVYTELSGFSLTTEYLRRNIRRRRSLIKSIVNGTTKDNKKIRVTGYIFSLRKIDTSKKNLIRKKMAEIIEKNIKENSLDSFIQKCVFGELATNVFRECKKIAPVRRVEISKCKLLSGR